MNALADPHALTLATARGRRLCKTRYADGLVDNYDAARFFDFSAVQVPDLVALIELLRELVERRDTCVLRGAIRDAARAHGVRRLLHADRATGDAPTLVEAPRAWIALDFDGLPLPAGTDPRDLDLCGRLVRAALPMEFRDAGCVVGATASHGFKSGAWLRLWFQLDRPLSGAHCKAWLRGAPVDLSVFRAVQPIYTAAPLFRGMPDPLPERLAALDGAALVDTRAETRVDPTTEVRVAERAAALRGGRPRPGRGPGQYVQHALVRAYSAIVRAPLGTRHSTALAEACSLSRLVKGEMLSQGDLARVIDRALQVAGKPAGEGEKIVAWAVASRGGPA
jgi:hypothetical protein